MDWIIEGFALNTREIAVLIWSAIAVLALGTRPNGWAAMGRVVRAGLQPVLLTAIAVAAVWIGGCVFLMERVGLWELANLKTTLLWAITFAIVTMFDLDHIGKPGFGKKVLRDTISATAVLVFIAEFATFNLLAELILVPFLVILGGAIAVAEAKPELAAARKLLNGISAAVGLALFGYSVWMIVAEFSAFAQRSTALEFSVPIVLSILFLPFIFLFARWVAYERVFGSFIYAVPDPDLRRQARRLGVRAFRMDIQGLSLWGDFLVRKRPQSRADLESAVSQIKEAQARERNPPSVETDEGWSPYSAKDFMADYGLPTSTWKDLGDGEWFCNAPLLNIDDGLLPNRLGYYLAGDAIVAGRLRLKLYINSPSDPDAAEAEFVRAGRELLNRAGLAEMSDILGDLATGENRVDRGTNMHVVTLTRTDWVGGIKGGYERILTVRNRSFESVDN